MRGLVARLLDLVIPPRCVGCGERDKWLCDQCAGSLTRLPVEHCARCAAPGVPTRVCGPCHRAPPAFDELRCPLLHRALARELVLSLKYRGHRHLAPLLGAIASELVPERVDLVVPVPLHPRRRAERGFNQSELVAREVSARRGLALDTGALVRERETPPQTGLSAREREANVRGAFVAARRLDGQTVLLVDDVCTTGATLGACARTLRRAGAVRVVAVTVTRAADML